MEHASTPHGAQYIVYITRGGTLSGIRHGLGDHLGTLSAVEGMATASGS